MITIKKSPTADSRTCDVTTVTETQLLESSIQHIADVEKGLKFFAVCLRFAASAHDYDKITDIAGFYSNFQTKFAERDWLDRHYELNRHHLSPQEGRVPDDVNLIDVLDYIADCVMAGKARTGEVRQLTISTEVLMRAFWNTAKLLENEVQVEE